MGELVQMMKRTSWLGPLYLSLAAAIWGGVYVVSKIVLTVIPPWVLLEIRFAIALVVLGIWAWMQKSWHVRREDIFLLAIVGLVGYTGSIGLQFIGTSLSGAALGSLITTASPALISLFAWWILRERLSGVKLLSLILATAGVIIVVGVGGVSGGSGSTLGNLVLCGAALTWALYTVLSRKLTQRYSSLTVTTWATLFGVIFTFPPAIWEYGYRHVQLPSDVWIWAGVLYLGIISTAVAFYLWNKGFEYMDTAGGSLFLFLQPIVGGALGVWLLGEGIGWNFFVGAVLIGMGIILATRKSSVENG